MMDAAVDLRDDIRKESYNPFIQMIDGPIDASFVRFMRDILSVLAGNAAQAFERLPIVENAHLLRGILYQGVWQKFNEEYEGGENG